MQLEIMIMTLTVTVRMRMKIILVTTLRMMMNSRTKSAAVTSEGLVITSGQPTGHTSCSCLEICPEIMEGKRNKLMTTRIRINLSCIARFRSQVLGRWWLFTQS